MNNSNKKSRFFRMAGRSIIVWLLAMSLAMPASVPAGVKAAETNQSGNENGTNGTNGTDANITVSLNNDEVDLNFGSGYILRICSDGIYLSNGDTEILSMPASFSVPVE